MIRLFINFVSAGDSLRLRCYQAPSDSVRTVSFEIPRIAVESMPEALRGTMVSVQRSPGFQYFGTLYERTPDAHKFTVYHVAIGVHPQSTQLPSLEELVNLGLA